LIAIPSKQKNRQVISPWNTINMIAGIDIKPGTACEEAVIELFHIENLLK
jgi:hypothetical protein